MAKKEISKEDSLRVRTIQEWLLKGHLITDVCRNIMEKWGMNDTQAMKMVADAFDDFAKRTTKGHTEARAFHVQIRLSLYKQCLEDKEYRIALQVLQDLAKIQAAYYPEGSQDR